MVHIKFLQNAFVNVEKGKSITPAWNKENIY